jgi:hypothetical protein
MTRRELLTMIGAAAAAGCRSQAPAGDKPERTESVTLTISGMI